ncbi:CATRA conflict system CASPASE/TPR repeat-associated protein, partial [Actinoplanes sp. NPDC026623]|uniref:CATRA conflict system CASPASE/TPR repeat-associated protein n=1 Tax=Actinoplanes sp. NPDC026623 TaxID=3155610 RepID=UPI0033D31182
MPARTVEQEFVAHLFAPLDGPHAEPALRQLRSVWENCRSQLGMTRQIDETGLDVRLPADPAAVPPGAVAGLQDVTVTFQAIARREHDVLNVSLVMATPVDAPARRRFGLGTVAPPGWQEFHRWWALLTAAGTGALLGEATIYQGKSRAASGADVRAELPVSDQDAAAWWLRPRDLAGLTVWDSQEDARGVAAGVGEHHGD